MIQEFRDFINKGNVFEAAVGLVMALAFKPVVDTFVSGIIMPIIAAIVGEPNFDGLTIKIGNAQILYGTFLTAVVSFLLMAWVVFMMVKAYNAFTQKKDAEEAPSGPSEIDLLTEIRDSLQK